MGSYEGIKMIKTFRGLLANDTEETIRLSTNNGSTGYRIVKFQVMGINEDKNYETVVQINKISITPTDSVDFSSRVLLAAALYGDTDSLDQGSSTVIFDREIFNQDIFVSVKATTGTTAINYYLELEQVKLDLNQNTVATLKNLRNVTTG